MISGITVLLFLLFFLSTKVENYSILSFRLKLLHIPFIYIYIYEYWNVLWTVIKHYQEFKKLEINL